MKKDNETTEDIYKGLVNNILPTPDPTHKGTSANTPTFMCTCGYQSYERSCPKHSVATHKECRGHEYPSEAMKCDICNNSYTHKGVDMKPRKMYCSFCDNGKVFEKEAHKGVEERESIVYFGQEVFRYKSHKTFDELLNDIRKDVRESVSGEIIKLIESETEKFTPAYETEDKAIVEFGAVLINKIKQ
jgi:hypothetical protein